MDAGNFKGCRMVGQDYTSVTTALGVFVDWSKIRPDVLEAACARGTAVHSACGAYALGVWVNPLPDSYQGYFQSFTAWFDKYVEKVYLVEKRLFCHTYKFKGKPDFVLKIKGDNLLSVVDIKTPITVGKTWASQLSSYKYLVETNENIKIGRLFSLRLKANGGNPIVDEYQHSDSDFAAFLAALTAYNYFT